MDLDWSYFSTEGSDSDTSVAFCLGYVLQTEQQRRGEQTAYLMRVISIQGTKTIGVVETNVRDAQIGLEQWVKRQAQSYILFS